MQKISASTTTANSSGEFTEGSSSAGVEATLLKAAWLNSLQRELVAVVEGGGLTLDAASDNQLLTAIRTIIRSGSSHYASDKGSANAYAVAYTPAVGSLVDGMVLRFTAKAANTGPSTFSPDLVAAKPVLSLNGQALGGGEIQANSQCSLIYSSAMSSWILVYASGGIPQGARRFATWSAKSVSATLLASDLGRVIHCGGEAAYTLTLPALTIAAFPAAVGATMHFNCAATVGITIAAPSGVSINTQSGTPISALTLYQNDTAELIFVSDSEWRLVGGSAAAVYSNAFQRRTRGIAASISSGGTPTANAAFSWVKNYPTFVAPCDGLVILTSNVNVGPGSNPAAVTNQVKILGSNGGATSSTDGTLGPMTNTTVLPVSRGETATISATCSGAATNVTWSAMTHNTAYWFIPSNSLAL